MKHVMLDAYGAEPNQIDDIKHINSFLNDLAYELDLEPIAPPFLIPYYYGKVKEDIGISSFLLLKGGHVTIHTFPLRECYFVDCFAQSDFDEKRFLDFFSEKMHFSVQKSIFNSNDRTKTSFLVQEYTPQVDFGPHYLSRIERDKAPTMEEMFDFLENITKEIGMDEITRPFVIKDCVHNPEFLSGIIIIAQSHISVHYSYKEKIIYGDLFSCAPFDFSLVNEAFGKIGKVISSELIARGTKHLYKVKSKVENADLLASTKWHRIVKKEES